MAKNIELEIRNREDTGKGASRRLRREGFVPGILYGKKTEALPLAVASLTLKKIIANENENAIIKLTGGGKASGKNVLIKDWDRDTMTRDPLHVDLYEIDMTKTVRVHVPLEFTGKARGLTEGGIVSPVVRQIEVECLPTDIPDHLTVDVTELGVGDSIHIEDLTVPNNVKKVFHDNYTIVTVAYIKEEVIAAPVAAEAAAAVAEPEVIGKGKKEAAEGEGAAAPAAGGAKAPAAGGEKKAEAKK
jgi:large subunit ribosomal protein L25